MGGNLPPADPHHPAPLASPGLAEDAHGELGAARADQPGEPHDLAPADEKIDVLDRHAARIERMLHRPGADLEMDGADLGGARREAVFQRAAHHEADDVVLIERGAASVLAAAVDGGDGAPVAEHGHRIRHPRHLVQLVGNQDRGDAAALEGDEEIEQRRALRLVEGGGGLVEDEKLHLLGERLGDFDQLLLADPEMGDQRLGRFMEPDLGEELLGPAVGHGAVDEEAPGLLVAEKEVLGDREEGDEGELLMDDDDARRF